MTILPILRDALLALCLLGSTAMAAEVREPKAGSPERKAIMEKMRAPVAEHVGKRVTFTGEVKASGAWAVFEGKAVPSDGVPPKDEGVASEMELDFFALLRLEDGEWKVLVWGFAGDVSLREEARAKYPQVPKALVP